MSGEGGLGGRPLLSQKISVLRGAGVDLPECQEHTKQSVFFFFFVKASPAEGRRQATPSKNSDIQIHEEHLTLTQGGMNFCQSSVLAQGIQHWHEGVFLLTPSPCRISSSSYRTYMESFP